MTPRILYFAGIDHPCLRTWVNHFRQAGHAAAVATYRPEVFAPWHGIAIHPYDSWLARRAERLSWSMGQSLRRRRLGGIVRRFAPDVVHIHWVDEHALKLTEVHRGPRIVTPCGSDVLRYPAGNPEVAAIAAKVLAAADVITCCSQAIRDAVVSLGGDAGRCVELYWGIDQDLFLAGLDVSPLRRKLGLQDRQVIFSNRGSRSFYNLPTVVRAFAAAAPRLPQATLLMLVDKPDARVDLAALAAALGVAGRVIIQPWVPQEQLPLYYNLADVFLSVVDSDGMGSSLVESIACGAFPIVSDIAANRQWLGRDGVGLLVPPGNSDALAAAMVQAIEQPALRRRFKDENVRLTAGRADVAANASRLGDLYRGLAAGKEHA